VKATAPAPYFTTVHRLDIGAAAPELAAAVREFLDGAVNPNTRRA
jgi:hypothetical protein